jgi:hypothetical protein
MSTSQPTTPRSTLRDVLLILFFIGVLICALGPDAYKLVRKYRNKRRLEQASACGHQRWTSEPIELSTYPAPNNPTVPHADDIEKAMRSPPLVQDSLQNQQVSHTRSDQSLDLPLPPPVYERPPSYSGSFVRVVLVDFEHGTPEVY